MDDIQAPPPPPMPSSALNTSPVPPPPAPKPLAPTPSIPAVPPPPPPRSSPVLSSTPKTGGGSKKILGLVLAILVLVAAGVGVAYFVKQSQANKVKTIVYWGLWEPEQVMRPLFDEFESTHPKIKIDYKMQSVQQYRERVTSAISQGTGPDIFRIHNTWTPMFKDLLAPVPVTVIPADQFSNTYYPVVSETLKVGGQYVAIPLEYDGMVMYVNDSLLRQTGLPVPQNWDELRKAAIAMSSCETETGVCAPNARLITSGVALGTTENVDHWQDVISVLMMQNNVDLTNPNTQAARDVIQYFSNFTKELGIWNANVPSSTSQFAAGKVGIYFGPSWRYFDLKAMSPNLAFSIHPIPQLPYDAARGEAPVNLASFWAEAVNARSKNAPESWELLKFLSDKSSLTKFHAEAAKTRAFGEPSPRQDMASDNTSDPVQSVLLQGAPFGKSWYLASATYDGETGINSQLSAAFAQSISGSNFNDELGPKVQTILTKYGLIAPITTPGK